MNQRFSLLRFYQSRIKRIFPALFVMLALSTAFTLVFFAPKDLLDYGKSLLAASGFLSNIYFWTAIDYFAGPAEFKPLLHTWSLAVEEQFYMFFPLILVGLYKLRNSLHALFLFLFLLAIASFSYCIYLSYTEASTAYYWAPSRAWQFLTGSLLAIGAMLRSDKIFDPRLHEFAGGIGLILIVYSTATFNKDTLFPGYAALLPTFGAALIIFGGYSQDNWVARLLGFKPVVWIGLNSYSLYLYHWPAFVFAKYLALDHLTHEQTTLTLVICFVLAYLSYRFVELPIRRSSIKSSKTIFASGALVTFLGIGVGLLLYLNHGFPERFKNGVFKESIAEQEKQFEFQQCYVFSAEPGHGNDQCKLGADNTEPSFVIWGDSHAHTLQPAVSAAAKENGISGHLVIRTTCPPLIGVDRIGRDFCSKFNEEMVQKLASRPDIKTVIFSARWAIATEHTRYKAEGGDSVPLFVLEEAMGVYPNELRIKQSIQDKITLFEAGLRRTTDALTQQGKQVIFVEQIPEIGYNVPMVIASSERLDRDIRQFEPTLEEYKQRNRNSSFVMREIAEQENVSILPIKDIFCDEQSCKFIIKNRAIYGDNNHINVFGAQLLTKRFSELFSSLKQEENAETNLPAPESKPSNTDLENSPAKS